MPFLEEFMIPRGLFNEGKQETTELHVFSDASPRNYGAVVCLCSKRTNATNSTKFICLKKGASPSIT